MRQALLGTTARFVLTDSSERFRGEQGTIQGVTKHVGELADKGIGLIRNGLVVCFSLFHNDAPST